MTNETKKINGNSISNVGISIESPLAEQHSHVDNERQENSIQNQSGLAHFVKITNTMKKLPMTPTRLEYSWWSTHSIEIAIGAFAFFTILMMAAGILIVGLTSPKAKVQKCQLKFTKTIKNPMEYHYGPRSVAVGNFNNDNDKRLDLVVANHAVDSISVFLDYNDGSFASHIAYPTGSYSAPYMVALGDFNNNDQIDIAVAYFGTNSIGIFVEFGNGSFANETIISTGSSHPIWIHIADLNNDTHIDIVTANYGTDSISIFYGYGNGRFSNSIIYSTGYDSSPFSVISGDLNNDNHLDLIIANYGTNNIDILLANGNGDFLPQMILSTGIDSHPYSIIVEHFNGDLLLDIAVANYGTNNVGILLNNGNNTFGSQSTYSLNTSSPYSISVGDINKDNRVDLVVTNKGINNIGVLLGFGNGIFSKPTMYQTDSSSSTSVVIADFNKDNFLDIIISSNDTNNMAILFGYDEGFQSEKTYPTGRTPQSVVVGDFNNDARLDIVVVNGDDNTTSVLLGYGDGSFANQTIRSTGHNPKLVAVGDFNNDTQLDIVVVNEGDNTISVLLGYGNGSFANQMKYVTGSSPNCVAVGDFNNDTRLDIVVAEWGQKTASVFLGYGNGSFECLVIRTNTTLWAYFVAVGDFNNDTLLDIVVANYFYLGNTAYILLGYGNGSFRCQAEYSVGSGLTSVVVGDFNNDTRLDIIVSGDSDKRLSLLLGYGNGSFEVQQLDPVSSSPKSIAVGDFNDDTRLDIVIGNTNDNTTSVLLGYGNGSFAREIKYSTGYGSASIAVGDFNNDTWLDIVVANEFNNTVSVLLHYANGSLRNPTTIASGDGSGLKYVSVDDFNNDTVLDLVVVNSGTNNIGINYGYGINGSFSKQTMFSVGSSSNPYSIAIEDFNKDGQHDFALANHGTKKIDMLLGDGTGQFERQIPYSSSLDFAPLVVTAGDFNNDGQSEIVVAYDNTDNIDTFAAYDNGRFEGPTHYSTTDIPRLLAIGDLNNDAQLDLVVTTSYLAGVEYSTSLNVLLGYGDGSLANETTFYLSNVFPISLTIADFNNDAQLDIAVGFDFINKPLIVFLGYGNGSFAHQIEYSTVTLSPRSIALGDFNNDTWLDIIFTGFRRLNGSVTILFGCGNGSFANETIYSTSRRTNLVTIGDFNNDTRLDIIVSNYRNNTVSVLLGYANGSFENEIVSSTMHNPQSIVIGDFNNDTRLDIVVVNGDQDSISVLLGYGNGSFANETKYLTGRTPKSVAVGDLNNDAQLDIVVANGRDNIVSVFLGYGNGSFANQTTVPTASPLLSVVVGDFNNDSRLDLVVANSVGETVSVLLGRINKVFQYERRLITGNQSFPRSIIVSDFNNDTRMDIAVTNSGTNTIGIFLGFGNNSFANQITFPTGSRPWSLAVGDLNNDSRLDIIVSNVNDSSISVLLGYGNGSFANQRTYSTGNDSQPYSVAIGDFNNDRFLDIIVANYLDSNVVIFIGCGDGTFTDQEKYLLNRVSLPFLVVVGDFNKDKKLDFAVANRATDNLNVFLQTC